MATVGGQHKLPTKKGRKIAPLIRY